MRGRALTARSMDAPSDPVLGASSLLVRQALRVVSSEAVRNGSAWSGAIRKSSVESDQRRVARWRERGAGRGASGTTARRNASPATTE